MQKLNADHHFEIGSTHKVCQDFALSGTMNPGEQNQYAYGIVADGCSATGQKHPVDFGARIISYCAANEIKSPERGPRGIMTPDLVLPAIGASLGQKIITNAETILDGLGLDRMCLDSTLLVAISNGICCFVGVYGDGNILIRYRDKRPLEIMSIQYESNAPYYLSYQLDPARKSCYENEFRESKKTLVKLDGGSYALDPRNAFCFVAEDVTNIESITICSDGLGSYREKSLTPVGLNEMADLYTDYFSYAGVFVQKRLCNTVSDICKKRELHHYDDVSSASIYFGKTKEA